MTSVPVPTPRVTSDKASRRTRHRWSVTIQAVCEAISGVSSTTQFMHEARQRSLAKREAIIEELQGGTKIVIPPSKSLAMKADLILPWKKLRIIRRHTHTREMPTYMSRSIFLHTSLLFRWLEKWRVSFASEGKMQAEAGRQLGNDNLVGEAAPFSFMGSGGVEINPAPFVYTPCLWDTIQIALERRVRMSCMCMYTMYLKTMLCRVGCLT